MKWFWLRQAGRESPGCVCVTTHGMTGMSRMCCVDILSLLCLSLRCVVCGARIPGRVSSRVTCTATADARARPLPVQSVDEGARRVTISPPSIGTPSASPLTHARLLPEFTAASAYQSINAIMLSILV